MCDTVCVVRPEGVLFAKNSDRDANEAQVLDWQPRKTHPASTLRCTWIEIPQVPETHAVLLSRPQWMWGAEMGTNEHGVTIGNEAVFTRHKVPKTGLTGMDLLRLALERADTADAAVDLICTLMDEHGQGGRCGYDDAGFRYFSSFLIADPRGAWVLETAGKHMAVERVSGARSISNGLSIPGFAKAHGDPIRTWAAAAKRRQQCTTAGAAQARTVADMAEIVRDHGGPVPQYSWFNGTLGAPCMHGGGLVASSVTTASWIAHLRPDGVAHWATATSAPCMGLFKPVQVARPVEVGDLWQRHERLHRQVLRDPERLLPRFIDQRDAVEAAWFASPPESAAAFAEADGLLEAWTDQVEAKKVADVRPIWARRYWARQHANQVKGTTGPGSNTACWAEDPARGPPEA